MSNNLLHGSMFSVLCLLTLFAVNKGSVAQKEIKADYFDPKHFGQGQTVVISIAGRKFSSVQSIIFSPPDGLTVGERKLVKGVLDLKAGNYRSYEIPISVSRDAALGKRTLLITTPEGQIKKQIEVVPHVPIISELKITHSSLGGQYIPARIECNFIVLDEAGDLGNKPSVIAELGPQAFGGTIVMIKASKTEAIENSRSVKVYVTYMPSLVPFATNGDFRVAIQDRNGYRSNQLAAKVFQ